MFFPHPRARAKERRTFGVPEVLRLNDRARYVVDMSAAAKREPPEAGPPEAGGALPARYLGVSILEGVYAGHFARIEVAADGTAKVAFGDDPFALLRFPSLSALLEELHIPSDHVHGLAETI